VPGLRRTPDPGGDGRTPEPRRALLSMWRAGLARPGWDRLRDPAAGGPARPIRVAVPGRCFPGLCQPGCCLPRRDLQPRRLSIGLRALAPGAGLRRSGRAVRLGGGRGVGGRGRARRNHGRPRTIVVINLRPDRFAVRTSGSLAVASTAAPTFVEGMRRVLARLVNRGLRAEVRTGNILTKQRYVALERVPGAGPIRVGLDGDAGHPPDLGCPAGRPRREHRAAGLHPGQAPARSTHAGGDLDRDRAAPHAREHVDPPRAGRRKPGPAARHLARRVAEDARRGGAHARRRLAPAAGRARRPARAGGGRTGGSRARPVAFLFDEAPERA
jgi:hypothetical protein